MKLEKGLLAFGLVVLFLALPNLLISKELKPGDPGYKDPAIAALISFIILGGGQIYVGDITRGLLFLLGGYAGFILLMLVHPIVGLVFLLGVGIFCVYDAYNLAKKYNAQGGKLKPTISELTGPNTTPIIAY